MMLTEKVKRRIKVFLASPGDLASEREKFKLAIHQLNMGFGDGANVEFDAKGWENTLSLMGRRSQSIINQDIDDCDVFILALYRRWGQSAPDAVPYSSYTEEEFHRALGRWERERKPEIFVFFKRVDAESESDPGEQLKRVMDFRRHLEETRQVLCRYFENESGFISEVERHLRAFVKGELPRSDIKADSLVLPLSALKEVEKAKDFALRSLKEAIRARDAEKEAYARLAKVQLEMAEFAAALSRDGRIEFASQQFSRLIVDSQDIAVLYLGYEFFNGTGDLDSAKKALEKWIDISGRDEKSQQTSAAFGNLGVIHKKQGELDKAESMYRKALAIDKAIGNRIGIANEYGNLGNIFIIRGDLERAEVMYQLSLNINDSLKDQAGMAICYGNLGLLYSTRGDNALAEEMFRKALSINESLGRSEGVANQFRNLGCVHLSRGELDAAEEMFRKSLAIEEKNSQKEGIAENYRHLGNVYMGRGNQAMAKDMYQRSMLLCESIGDKEGMMKSYADLGTLFHVQSDFEHSEKMYGKSLAIMESLGNKGDIANLCGRLGKLHQDRGDHENAMLAYKRAQGIYAELRSPLEKKYLDLVSGLPVEG